MVGENDDIVGSLEKLMIADALGHLRDDNDEKLVLRKVILLLIMMLDVRTDAHVQTLVRFLLGEFEPISSRFREHTHPISGGYMCVRGVDQKNNLRLFISDEYVAYLTGDNSLINDQD